MHLINSDNNIYLIVIVINDNTNTIQCRYYVDDNTLINFMYYV